VELLFCTVLPDTRQSNALSEGSHASPACPSYKSGVKMMVSMEHAGGMKLTGENRALGNINRSRATLPTVNLTWTGLTSNPGLRGDRDIRLNQCFSNWGFHGTPFFPTETEE
jgi:hypothetical protein